jgi:hypothetical protein
LQGHKSGLNLLINLTGLKLKGGFFGDQKTILLAFWSPASNEVAKGLP